LRIDPFQVAGQSRVVMSVVTHGGHRAPDRWGG
jgi:hypothetical protein